MKQLKWLLLLLLSSLLLRQLVQLIARVAIERCTMCTEHPTLYSKSSLVPIHVVAAAVGPKR